MRTDKESAFRLRRQGKSYKKISRELGVSVSTLSVWFKGVDFSEEIRQSLTKKAIEDSTKRLHELNKIRGDSLVATYEIAEKEALSELKKYIGNPLFVSGVVAYWGEGDKSSGRLVRLANTDPQMIKLFSKFLTTFCSVPNNKLRGALYTYADLDEVVCKKYWKKHTGLKHFHKTQVLPSCHKTKKLSYGTCTILVANTYLKRKMLVWIDHLSKMVLNVGLATEK